MNHLEAARAPPHFAETAHVHAWLKLGLLLPGEMEEAQGQLAAAVADAHEQVAAAAKRDLGQQHFAADETARAGHERTDAHELRAVLVTQR